MSKEDPYHFRRVFIDLLLLPCAIAWIVAAIFFGFKGWFAFLVGSALGVGTAILFGRGGYRLACLIIAWLDRLSGNY